MQYYYYSSTQCKVSKIVSTLTYNNKMLLHVFVSAENCCIMSTFIFDILFLITLMYFYLSKIVNEGPLLGVFLGCGILLLLKYI